MTTRTTLFETLKETVNQAATQDDPEAAIHMLTTAKEQINEIGNTYIAEIEAALKAEA